MLISFLAITIMIGSIALILCNLRMVLRDTADVVLSSLGAGRPSRQMVPNVAFCLLWLLIFALAYF